MRRLDRDRIALAKRVAIREQHMTNVRWSARTISVAGEERFEFDHAPKLRGSGQFKIVGSQSVIVATLSASGATKFELSRQCQR